MKPSSLTAKLEKKGMTAFLLCCLLMGIKWTVRLYIVSWDTVQLKISTSLLGERGNRKVILSSFCYVNLAIQFNAKKYDFLIKRKCLFERLIFMNKAISGFVLQLNGVPRLILPHLYRLHDYAGTYIIWKISTASEFISMVFLSPLRFRFHSKYIGTEAGRNFLNDDISCNVESWPSWYPLIIWSYLSIMFYNSSLLLSWT